MVESALSSLLAITLSCHQNVTFLISLRGLVAQLAEIITIINKKNPGWKESVITYQTSDMKCQKADTFSSLISSTIYLQLSAVEILCHKVHIFQHSIIQEDALKLHLLKWSLTITAISSKFFWPRVGWGPHKSSDPSSELRCA